MLRLLHGSAAEAQKPHPLCQEGLQLLVSPRRQRCACIPVGQKAYLGIVVLRGVAHEIYPYVIALDTEPSLSVVPVVPRYRVLKEQEWQRWGSAIPHAERVGQVRALTEH